MEAIIAQLEEQLRGLTIGVKTKDLSLAASIKEWSRQDNARPVTEFISQVEQCARLSNWSREDLTDIVRAKLIGEARVFINGRDHLAGENVSYEELKAALVDRFSEKLPARYHYNQLHEAAQGREETPIQFLDRCRALSQKTVRKSADPTEQRILREDAETRLLTIFVYGLRGETGHELRIRNPDSIEQALAMATVIYNANKMENRHKEHAAFAVQRDERYSEEARKNGPPRRRDRQPWKTPVQRFQERAGRDRERVRAPLICYGCGQPGHIARYCKAERNPAAKREKNSTN
ncbi:hypothetical protein B7P43_G17748 [Cryptotermes secundus]|uniref:CCHC-type domain-containing protein n=1 Tax=Cryptotermes secundus TaxID=105785 RepID=A0A2J7REV3_9NEOP|nr:hypothetical protein B7P43_G17748 [Cryptotermes secundus]